MKTQLKFKTNLNCSSCVATVTPFLEGVSGVAHWHVDTANPDKPLFIDGDNLSSEEIRNAVSKAGFKVLGEIKTISAPSKFEAYKPTSGVEILDTEKLGATTMSDAELSETKAITYYPIFLLAGFLVGVTALVEVRIGSFNAMRSMATFMGAFFLTFSFFKLLDIRGFASAYSMYDIVARRLPAYGFVYPFLELLLGVAYVTSFQPWLTNIATLVIMSISSIGVIQSVLHKKAIRCACLGTVFQLPMSTITIAEDSLMILMSLAMLVSGN